MLRVIGRGAVVVGPGPLHAVEVDDVREAVAVTRGRDRAHLG